LEVRDDGSVFFKPDPSARLKKVKLVASVLRLGGKNLTVVRFGASRSD